MLKFLNEKEEKLFSSFFILLFFTKTENINNTLRQGFILPNILTKIIDKDMIHQTTHPYITYGISFKTFV